MKFFPEFRTLTIWCRTNFPLILAVLFGLSFSLTFSGYLMSCPKPAGGWVVESILIAAFRAVSHFTLNSLDGDLPDGNFVFGMVAAGRLLAVAFVALSTASLLQSLFHFRDRLFRWKHGHRDSKHSIVIGYGWKGRSLVANRPPGSEACFVIESDDTTQSPQAVSGNRISLIHGDATGAETLVKLIPQTASAIYVCTGEDETNMQVIQALSRFKLQPATIVCVDLQSWGGFDVLQKSIPADSPIDLRIFNTEAITTRRLLEEHPMDRFDGPGDVRGAEIIILGDGLTAWELLRQILQHGIFEPGKDLAITWLAEDPENACNHFTDRYPCFTSTPQPNERWHAMPQKVWGYGSGARVLPEVRFLKLPISGRGVLEMFEESGFLQPGEWATSVYIVFDDAARSAALATLILPKIDFLRPDRLKLHFYFNTRENLHRKQIQDSLKQEFPRVPIIAFSDFLGDCSMKAVRGDALDQTARRVNGIYSMKDFQKWLKARLPDRSADCPANPDDMLGWLVGLNPSDGKSRCVLDGFDEFCFEIWSKCPENNKESNRQAAAHANIKKQIRDRIQPSDPGGAALVLAKIEHRRWCVEYLLRGFRPLTRIPSDPSTASPFVIEQKEKTDIDSWFTEDPKANKKGALKSLKLHVDLVPFADFRSLFDPARAKIEEDKDLNQIIALDLILR